MGAGLAQKEEQQDEDQDGELGDQTAQYAPGQCTHGRDDHADVLSPGNYHERLHYFRDDEAVYGSHNESAYTLKNAHGIFLAPL